jgi:hypothetical protein
MTLLNQVIQRDNLSRAWRWLQSNPDAAYKGYFRALYANYRVAEDALIEDLRDRLRSGAYQPAHACKIHFPKPSGGLRPYSLLTVEDQIVYQALVNVVAERLTPRVRERQMTEVFSHMYAGKKSTWFYRKWQNGYREMNRAAREAFSEGYRYAATFDLTAFYDSVDHQVIRHFLEDLGCDRDFNRLLVRCLVQWTATLRKERIYLGHGIPQGPLSSGLLAEVVLRHLDEERTHRAGVRYLRFVDDIRLFGQTEQSLRWAVAELDLLSKDVGLFPQASKTATRKVTDIEAELKSVSRPETRELDLDAEAVEQAPLRRRIRELSPNYRVTDPTEFRFLLGRAEPNAGLDRRLIRVLARQPYLYGNVLRYFRRYVELPAEVANWLVGQLKGNPVYAAFAADLLRTAEDRLDMFRAAEVDEYVRTHWLPDRLRAADQISALGVWGVRRRVLTHGQIARAVRQLPEWWARSELVAALTPPLVGQKRMRELLADKLSDPVSDVAIAAAVQFVRSGRSGPAVVLPGGVQSAAGPVLEEFGFVPDGAGRACGVARSFERLLVKKLPPMDWATFFGKNYVRAERHAVFCYSYAGVDATAWVNAMDVFNDWLLGALAGHDSGIGNYRFGKLGGFVKEPTSRFARKYPAIWRLASELHRKRRESHLSHAWEEHGGVLVRPTSYIPYRYLRTAKGLIEQGFRELAAAWPGLAPARKCRPRRRRRAARGVPEPV